MTIKNTTFKDPIKAIFLQEHNLKDPTDHKKLAEEHGFYLFAVPLNSRTTKGGTAILIPKKQLESVDSKESHHAALRRVRATTLALPDGRGIAIETYIFGKLRRLASVYAPSPPQERVRFFLTLPRIINQNTVLGIDANCVPDVTIDRRSSAASRPTITRGPPLSTTSSPPSA